MKRPSAQFSCHRKRRHPNRRDAKAARDRRQAADGIKLSVYRCDFCGGWHLCKRDNHRGRPGNAGRNRPTTRSKS